MYAVREGGMNPSGGLELIRMAKLMSDLNLRLSQIVGDEDAPEQRITFAHALRRFSSATEFRRSAALGSWRHLTLRGAANSFSSLVFFAVLLGTMVVFLVRIGSGESISNVWYEGLLAIGAAVMLGLVVRGARSTTTRKKQAVAEWTRLREELDGLASGLHGRQLASLEPLDQLIALLQRERTDFEARRWARAPDPDHVAHVTQALISFRRELTTLRRGPDEVPEADRMAGPSMESRGYSGMPSDSEWNLRTAWKLRVVRRGPNNSRRDWLVHGPGGPIGRLVAQDTSRVRGVLAVPGNSRTSWDRRSYKLRDAAGDVLVRIESLPDHKQRRVTVGGLAIGSVEWPDRHTWSGQSLRHPGGVATRVSSLGLRKRWEFRADDSTVLARVSEGGRAVGGEWDTIELLIDADDPLRPLVLIAWLLSREGAPQGFHESLPD